MASGGGSQVEIDAVIFFRAGSQNSFRLMQALEVLAEENGVDVLGRWVLSGREDVAVIVRGGKERVGRLLLQGFSYEVGTPGNGYEGWPHSTRPAVLAPVLPQAEIRQVLARTQKTLHEWGNTQLREEGPGETLNEQALVTIEVQRDECRRSSIDQLKTLVGRLPTGVKCHYAAQVKDAPTFIMWISSSSKEEIDRTVLLNLQQPPVVSTLVRYVMNPGAARNGGDVRTHGTRKPALKSHDEVEMAFFLEFGGKITKYRKDKLATTIGSQDSDVLLLASRTDACAIRRGKIGSVGSSFLEILNSRLPATEGHDEESDDVPPEEQHLFSPDEAVLRVRGYRIKMFRDGSSPGSSPRGSKNGYVGAIVELRHSKSKGRWDREQMCRELLRSPLIQWAAVVLNRPRLLLHLEAASFVEVNEEIMRLLSQDERTTSTYFVLDPEPVTKPLDLREIMLAYLKKHQGRWVGPKEMLTDAQVLALGLDGASKRSKQHHILTAWKKEGLVEWKTGKYRYPGPKAESEGDEATVVADLSS